MVDELYFYLIAMVRGFVEKFDMGMPVYVCGGWSTPVVFGFDIFICVLLKAESAKVVLIVVGDIFLIEIYYKGCEENMIVEWRSSIGIGDIVC